MAIEPLLNNKRDVASFLPYRKVGERIEFYLQKREKDRRILPGFFTMFGGGIEGDEMLEQACLREVAEELSYVPQKMQYFSQYEGADAVVHVFIEEVGEDFESKVTVLEGEYGVFVERHALRATPEAALLTRLAAMQVALFLEGKPTAG